MSAKNILHNSSQNKLKNGFHSLSLTFVQRKIEYKTTLFVMSNKKLRTNNKKVLVRTHACLATQIDINIKHTQRLSSNSCQPDNANWACQFNMSVKISMFTPRRYICIAGNNVDQ